VIDVVGVVLPVHDEEALLPGALWAIERAAGALSPSIRCQTVVVLDSCGDASSAIATRWAARLGAVVIRRECRSVGLARRIGSLELLARWSGVDRDRIWLATTDADSRVPQDWLTAQVDAHGSGVDLWAGRVRVAEESLTVSRWTECYEAEREPIHGTSLGFSAAMYTELGGFRGLPSGEDRDLYDRAMAAGFNIRHARTTIVTTSSRRKGRAPEGFASVLGSMDQESLTATARPLQNDGAVEVAAPGSR
jgi:Glycosyl transferase family 2